MPSLIRRRRVGWPDEQPGERGDGVHLAVGQQPQLLELVGGEQVGLVDGHDDGSAAFVFLGGEVVHGLGDQAAVWNRGTPPRPVTRAA